ncbi:MAG: hypothetical protein KDD25_08190, partial [Bdellovibrionales bacterium]|nr:hypothetical protein [Bdellovibrionales bacterium]
MTLFQVTKNQDGYILISSVVLTPILISALFVASIGILFSIEKAKGLSLCRSSLLDLQRSSSQSIQALQSLNPQATRLRLENQNAQRSMAATFGTPGFPAAAAYYAEVKAQQALLRVRQIRILNSARAKSSFYLSKLRSEMKLQLSGLRRFDSPISHSLAVFANPPNSLSPDYETVPNFSERQSVFVRWEQSSRQVFPKFLANYVNLDQFSYQLSCGSTLKQELSQFSAVLKKGRRS